MGWRGDKLRTSGLLAHGSLSTRQCQGLPKAVTPRPREPSPGVAFGCPASAFLLCLHWEDLLFLGL